MKFFPIILIFLSCSKQHNEFINAQRCGWVAHKFYMNPPMDTTLINRTYWLQWSPDTTCLPSNPSCGYYYNIQVPKSCYDTMLINGAAATRYCQ